MKILIYKYNAQDKINTS